MKTFVLFIGGSGVRVLRSLTMLLASGVKPVDCDEIVPIVIDYDKENADLIRAKEVIEQYRFIHHSIYKNLDAKDTPGFFSTKMSPVGRGDTFFVSILGDEIDFAKKINYEDMSDLTKKFLKTIYSDWRDSGNQGLVDKKELYLNIKKGFKGNPNIGSAIFSEVLEKPEMKDFFQSVNEGDRIFIVGSIFGGTGSTGIPQIVEQCRKMNDNRAAVQTAPIGINVILPYFNLTNDSKKENNSTIDSNTFNSKTKAALYYYNTAINNKVQELYYIGSVEPKQFDNNDGGKEQKNESHIVDLLSAMSVIEFASRKDLSAGSPMKSYEYVTQESMQYSLSIFNSTNDVYKQRYLYPFKSFGFFWKHYKDSILPGPKGKAADDSQGFLSSPKVYYKYCFKEDVTDDFRSFRNALEEFLFMKNSSETDASYESWLKELEKTQFIPFRLDADISKMINVMDKGESFITKQMEEQIVPKYDAMATSKMKTHGENNKSKQAIFMDIASTACLELAKGKQQNK